MLGLSPAQDSLDAREQCARAEWLREVIVCAEVKGGDPGYTETSKMLAESGLAVTSANDMADGARRVGLRPESTQVPRADDNRRRGHEARDGEHEAHQHHGAEIDAAHMTARTYTRKTNPAAATSAMATK